LEDALRTATLPDGDGLLVVRRLDLGVISDGASPQTLALAISRLVSGVVRRARPFDDSAAEQAEAVRFPDEVTALVALAERVAGGRPPTAWFWSRAVAGYAPEAAPATTLRLLVRRALEQPAGPAALVALVEGLVRRRRAAPLLEAISAADAEAVSASVGWSPMVDAEIPAALAPVPGSWRAVLERWVRRWGTRDPRIHLLASIAVVSTRPQAFSTPQLVGPRAVAWIEGVAPRPAPRATGVADAPAAIAADASAPGPKRPPPADEPAPVGAPTAARGPTPEEIEPPEPPTEAPRVGAACSTSAGGLYFLLRVLIYLDIEGTLESHADALDWDLPRRVLWGVCDRLEVSDEDVVRGPLRSEDPPPAPERVTFLAPEAWLVLEDLPPALRDVPTDAVVDLWIAALEAWLARFTELDLPALVFRPATLRCTRTKLELRFELDDADVRVRRAGLDCDPGWLPWFGRVVRYYYYDAAR